MSIFVVTNGLVVINGIDLSDHIQECAISLDADAPDKTTYGNTTKRVAAGGLKSWSIDMSLLQDYDAAKVHATLRPLVGTSACFEIRPVNACSSSNNPIISGIGVLVSYPPFGGAVGDIAMADITFENASDLSFASSSS